MLIVIGLTEVLLLTAFFMLERRVPARAHSIVPHWNLWFLAIVCFSQAWLKVMLYFWVVMGTTSILPIKATPVLVQGLFFYAIYSYWQLLVPSMEARQWHTVAVPAPLSPCSDSYGVACRLLSASTGNTGQHPVFVFVG